ncbi:hypothetical protein HMPREF0083_02246 [Aneurinibacillus aneurinilyticus ATCC 12856]|uniref:Uncharacterized protein n=1 Tax=Aneurinibacillus aneurinilyticus ATCC 12856 TaxID=649747 RepID=U1X3X0_ANEAE|nr:hypothetical protein HMPREF0083_02246 [Aneurinibacillus aneurinilyticus ATCC 12856]
MITIFYINGVSQDRIILSWLTLVSMCQLDELYGIFYAYRDRKYKEKKEGYK